MAETGREAEQQNRSVLTISDAESLLRRLREVIICELCSERG
jgi:hypothetical protein